MMTTMSSRLWRRLPSDITELVLSFLPVPVLCRYRTVCKKWNALICNPEFGALCIQNAKQDAQFIVGRYLRRYVEDVNWYEGTFGRNHGWSFLDLKERRWYTIKHDGEEVFDNYHTGNLAMDGGLVCQYLESDEDISVFVSNPIAKTTTKLPPFHFNRLFGYGQTMPATTMVVDRITYDYKIFLVHAYCNRIAADNPLVVIYESVTNEWRISSPNAPPIGPLLGTARHRRQLECSILFEERLYVLFCVPGAPLWDSGKYWLWSYNYVEDVWKDTGIQIEARLHRPELVVSDGRLFLVTWVIETASKSLCISEILVEDKACTASIFRMELKLARHILDAQHTVCCPEFYDSAPPPLDAFGSHKSIILMSRSSSGISIVNDLVTGSWDLLPANPFPCNVGELGEWFPKHTNVMNLILPQWTNPGYPVCQDSSTGSRTVSVEP